MKYATLFLCGAIVVQLVSVDASFGTNAQELSVSEASQVVGGNSNCQGAQTGGWGCLESKCDDELNIVQAIGQGIIIATRDCTWSTIIPLDSGTCGAKTIGTECGN